MPARVSLVGGRTCEGVCVGSAARFRRRVWRVCAWGARSRTRACVREHMRTHPAAPFRDGTGRCGQAHLGPARARRPDSTGPGEPVRPTGRCLTIGSARIFLTAFFTGPGPGRWRRTGPGSTRRSGRWCTGPGPSRRGGSNQWSNQESNKWSKTLVRRAGPEQARGFKQGVCVVKQGSKRIQTSGQNGQVGSNKWSKV